MSTGLCDRTYVFDSGRTPSYPTMDFKVREETDRKRPRRQSLRISRDDRSMSALRKLYGSPVGWSPVAVGFENCGNLVTNLKTMEPNTEKYLAHLLLRLKQALKNAELGKTRTGSLTWGIRRLG